MNTIKWNDQMLNELLTTPSDALVSDIAKIDGDIMVLGAGGKMGPDICTIAAKAIKKAGINKKVYAVSRFSDKDLIAKLDSVGVTVICADLL